MAQKIVIMISKVHLGKHSQGVLFVSVHTVPRETLKILCEDGIETVSQSLYRLPKVSGQSPESLPKSSGEFSEI
jgi:hypothetical protein